MSTPDRLNSKGTIVLKSETFDTNATSGNGTTRVYTGSRSLILAQKQVELGFGAVLTKVESTGDGNYQLTAGYAWDASSGSSATPPVNQHELEINMAQVSVLNNAKLIATFSSTFGSAAAGLLAMGYVRRAVQSFQSNGTTTTTAEAQIDTDYPIATYPTQNALIKNAFRGIAYHEVENSLEFNTVYRRRITAASYNQVQAGFVGAGKYWTTSEIVAFENVPATWWFQLPSNYIWLKSPPIVSTVSGNKTEITYNYTAGVFAWGLLYDAYGAAVMTNF